MRAIAASSAGQPVGPADRLGGAGAGGGAGRGVGLGLAWRGGADDLAGAGRAVGREAGRAFFVVAEGAGVVVRAGRLGDAVGAAR